MADTPTPIAEIDHGPSKFDQFLEKNQKKLVILAILIFLAVLAYVFFKGYNKMQDEKAGALFTEANTEEDYKKVISEYPSKASAGTAAYKIATMRTSDEDAIEAFNHFISTYPDHPWVPLAEFNLAQRQINAGKTTEATATLNSLVGRENASYLLPKAKIALGDIALNNNERELAKELYNEAAEFNQSKHAFAAEAKAKLIYMNAKKPQIVDAPPKPIEPKPLDPAKPSDAQPENTQPVPEVPEPPASAVTPAIPLEPATPAEPAEPAPAEPNDQSE